MKKYMIAAAASLLVAQGAAANDWDGLYAGVAASNHKTAALYTDLDFAWWGDTLENRDNGVGTSLFAGFNLTDGALVYGVELELADYGVKDELPYSLSDYVAFTDTYDTGLALKLRAGLAVGNGLLYLSMGSVDADISHELIAVDPDDSLAEFEQSNRGTQYAVGIEGLVTDAIAVRMEFSETDFEADEVFSAAGDRFRVEDEISSFSLGASFHF